MTSLGAYNLAGDLPPGLERLPPMQSLEQPGMSISKKEQWWHVIESQGRLDMESALSCYRYLVQISVKLCIIKSSRLSPSASLTGHPVQKKGGQEKAAAGQIRSWPAFCMWSCFCISQSNSSDLMVGHRPDTGCMFWPEVPEYSLVIRKFIILKNTGHQTQRHAPPVHKRAEMQ